MTVPSAAAVNLTPYSAPVIEASEVSPPVICVLDAVFVIVEDVLTVVLVVELV